jgi:hypothetical protein
VNGGQACADRLVAVRNTDRALVAGVGRQHGGIRRFIRRTAILRRGGIGVRVAIVGQSIGRRALPWSLLAAYRRVVLRDRRWQQDKADR